MCVGKARGRFVEHLGPTQVAQQSVTHIILISVVTLVQLKSDFGVQQDRPHILRHVLAPTILENIILS
jgi:hypothetical protein